ncbi:hypothetical protein VTN77DRAFT_8798 [Rasamsonia byssochlamydoides]|uniref:uncharacterized protein n=1 Tax=Rasamsonia byssochlamydoides TaxID=89139 RepID=UPI0037442915
MMRSKPASSMQKTYDECYLMCSTAVYFEGQNNEAEALRSWRSALETIYYHNAYRVPPNYVPKTETEKALQESIRQLELQCKERVDLLEALQESRKEAQEKDEQGPSRSRLEKGKRPSSGINASTPGWIGEGTIPAVDYLDLSKPASHVVRPTASSKSGLLPQLQRSHSGDPSPASQKPASPTPTLSGSSTPLGKTTSRGSSPERRKVMLTTLRQKDPKKSSKSKASSSQNGTLPAAWKAAGLAWGSSSEKVQNSGDVSAARPRYCTSSDSEVKRDPDGKLSSSDETSKRSGRRQTPSDYTPSSSWQHPDHFHGKGSSGVISSSSHDSRQTVDQLDPAASTMRAAPSKTPTKPIPPPKPPAYREHPPSKSISSQTLSKTNSVDQTPRKSLPRTLSSTPSNRVSPANSSSNGDDRFHRTRADAAHRGSSAGRKMRPENLKPRVTPPSSDQESSDECSSGNETDYAFRDIMKKLPRGVDVNAARQILNDVVVRGDEVHWDDIAGLEAAKKALKEAVVYPFLRPDLFMGLREPARGLLLFGPPGTGKTMLARAVATESKSTFFSVSASSLTSKWHGESEKLVRALFALAKALAPSIIFVDEIDSLLSTRSSGTEHEASRRSKTEFLIQWSDLQRAAAGREQSDNKREGDASRVLVLAATNMPWDIDEAARRRFVRRQYIPLPEEPVREQQLRKLLSHQKHDLSDDDIQVLVKVTEGFSGSDITALAKDAAMGPLRNLGEALLHTPTDQIRPIRFEDFEASLYTIRPSVSREGLQKYEDWARQYGERGG